MNVQSIIALVLLGIFLLYGYRKLDKLGFFDYSTDMITNLFSGDSLQTERAFNGRINTYKYAFDAFKESSFTIIFGKGSAYSEYLAHNYILDVLARSGIIGFFSVLIIYVTIMTELIKNIDKNIYAKPALIMMCMVLINSMWEPCIDGFLFSIPYYMIIGMGLQKSCDIRNRGKEL